MKERVERVVQPIKSLNLFRSNSTNPHNINREKQMTWLFIVSLLISSVILTTFIASIQQTNVTTINDVSENTYKILDQQYRSILECPCSRSDIPYSEILQVTFKFHQLCSSGFVSPLFIAQLHAFNRKYTYKYDFMIMSGFHFTHLTVLCYVLQDQFTVSYRRMLSGRFYVSKLINVDEFDIRMKIESEALNYMQASGTNRILSEVYIGLINMFAISPLDPSFDLHISENGHVHMIPIVLNNCSCITHPTTCSSQGAFYAFDFFNQAAYTIYNVSGIKLGCSPYQSTLLSTLECWYSTECYEKVRKIRVS